MAETTTATPEKKKAAAPATPAERTLKRAQRRHACKAGREKLAAKLVSDKEFAKTYFEGRSKRSTDKKAAFRKKKSRKK